MVFQNLFDRHGNHTRHYAVFLVGHTDCGGAKASYNAAHYGQPIPGPLGHWLAPLVALSKALGRQVKPDLLVVKNVEEQFNKLVASSEFRGARRIGRCVH